MNLCRLQRFTTGAVKAASKKTIWSMFNSFSASALMEGFVDVVQQRECLHLQPLDARVTFWLHCIFMHTVNTVNPLRAVLQEHAERCPGCRERLRSRKVCRILN